jgi:hypothetical protein
MMLSIATWIIILYSRRYCPCDGLHLDYDLRIFAPFREQKIISSELTSLPSVTLITEAVGRYLEVRLLFLCSNGGIRKTR